MTTCKSCGAAIRWVTLPSRKTMPLDAEPCGEGNVVVDGELACVLKQGTLGKLPAGTPLYRSHFVSCPDAKQHRKA